MDKKAARYDHSKSCETGNKLLAKPSFCVPDLHQMCLKILLPLGKYENITGITTFNKYRKGKESTFKVYIVKIASPGL